MLLKYICKTTTKFDDILRLNGYPENTIEQTKRPQNPQQNPQPGDTEWSYLKIPYISERLNHEITNIFRKENIPVRIAHKSHTLRQALSHTSTERKCTRDKCRISNTGLHVCLRRNEVYQLTCNSCDQQYIGSTTRFIHDRVREHINNENSSVKKHIYSCQNSIFLRLTAELAGKYALIVIFVCLCVGMWGILAGVYILAVKEWVFHLGLAFRRSCFVFIVSYIFLAVCVLFFSSFSFL